MEDDCQQERPPGVSERIYPFPTNKIEGAVQIVRIVIAMAKPVAIRIPFAEQTKPSEMVP